MYSTFSFNACLLALTAGGLFLPSPVAVSRAADTLPADQGFTRTAGGRGGRIVRVTNLEKSGDGSLAAALALKQPRIIVFEVAGVIDLAGTNLHINEPFVTVAGQTAPTSGISLIRGGMLIGTHDVILQHLRIRPGDMDRAKNSGWEVDGITTAGGAHDVIVDHCSCTWATDENLSASGPRFSGDTPDKWRAGTSHRITFSNCLIAEGLSHSTHAGGEHSKGSLVHDNVTEVALFGNLYANNVQRNPLFKGGARGIVVNNLIVNPGNKAIHFALIPDEWGSHAWVAGQMAVVGNLMIGGADTSRQLALMTHARGPLKLYLRDNRSLDREGGAAPLFQTLGVADATNGCQLVNDPPLWPKGLQPLPVAQVQAAVLANVGARPWERDAIDRRIIEQAGHGSGRVINSEQEVGGYPNAKPIHAPFNPTEWNLDTMERRRSGLGHK